MTSAREFQLHHLSYSQCYTFSRCPRKWYLQKVKRVPMVPLFSTVSGRSLHKGLETNNLELQQTNKGGLSPNEIVEVAVTEFEQTPHIEELMSDGLPLKVPTAKDRLVKQITPTVTEYKSETEGELLDTRGPISGVELPLEFEMGGVPFEGVIDLVQENCFLDYKLAARKKSSHQLRYDPQMRLYEHVLGQGAAIVQLMRSSKRVETLILPDDQVARDGVCDWVLEMAAAVQQALKSGLFPRCTPGQWECSRKTCEFFRLCWSYAKDPE